MPKLIKNVCQSELLMSRSPSLSKTRIYGKNIAHDFNHGVKSLDKNS